MSLAFVRPFFRERLEALGYEEHDKPFLPNVLPANTADKSFHLETGVITSSFANQIVHSFEFPLTVRIYRVGYSETLAVMDEAHADAQAILTDFLDPAVRLGTMIKDIIPNSISFELFDATNVDTIVVEINFTAKLEFCFKPSPLP